MKKAPARLVEQHDRRDNRDSVAAARSYDMQRGGGRGCSYYSIGDYFTNPGFDILVGYHHHFGDSYNDYGYVGNFWSGEGGSTSEKGTVRYSWDQWNGQGEVCIIFDSKFTLQLQQADIMAAIVVDMKELDMMAIIKVHLIHIGKFICLGSNYLSGGYYDAISAANSESGRVNTVSLPMRIRPDRRIAAHQSLSANLPSANTSTNRTQAPYQ